MTDQPNASEFPESPAVAKEAEPQVKDVDGIPYCRKHHCRMKRYSGGKKGSTIAYYGCPVENCEEKGQMIRTKNESIVPPKPLSCPHCKTICERNQMLSNAMSVVLQCSGCGWRSNTLPLPSFVAQHMSHRHREYVPEIGQR